MTHPPELDAVDPIASMAAMMSDGAALRALLAHPDVRIPTCPDWSITELVAHVGGAHRWALAVVEAGGAVVERDLPPAPDDVGPWFDDGLEALGAALRGCGPDDVVWNPFDPDGRAAWWIAKMAVETAIHRWDGEYAVGAASDIDESVAGLGIDEMVALFIPGLVAFNHGRPTGSLRLRSPARDWDVELGTGPGECVLSGTASDILLFLWNRLADVHGRLAVTGGDAVIDEWSAIRI